MNAPTFPDVETPEEGTVKAPVFPDAATPSQRVQAPLFPEVPVKAPTFPDAPGGGAVEAQDAKPPVNAHPKSASGWMENWGHRWEDFKDTAAGLLGLHGWRAMYDAYKESSKPLKPGYGEVASNIGDELSKLPSQMGDSMANAWSKWYQKQDPGKWVEDPEKPGHFIKQDGSLAKMAADKAYYEPFSTAADVYAAWDLLAQGARATGKVGKLAQGKVGPGWEASGEAAGAGGAFDKLERAGTAMQNWPGEMIKKGWEKANAAIGRDVPAARLYGHIYDEEMSGVKPQVNADQNEHMARLRALDESDRDFAHNANLQGLTQEEVQHGATPEAMEAANDYKNYVENVREKTLKEKGLPDFNDDVLQGRLAKQYAKARYGKTGLSAEELEAMKAEMEGLAYKPTYVPSEAELRSGMTLEDSFDIPDSQTGKVGFLEKYTKGRLSRDPLEYFPRVIDSFRKTEAHLNFAKRILEEPSLVRSMVSSDAFESVQRELEGAEEKLDKLGARSKKRPTVEQKIRDLNASLNEMRGNVMTDEMKKYRMPETGVYGKYLNKKARAEGLYLEELARKYGEKEALRMVSEDYAFNRRAMATSEIVANPTLKRMLQTEFFRVGGPLRWWLDKYDGINNFLNRVQTQYNPRFYAGKSVGSALIQMLSGTGPKNMARARELEAVLPRQVRHVPLEGGAFQKLKNAVEIRAGLEEAAKAGIITKRTARRMSLTNDLGWKTAQDIERDLPAVLNSTNELRDIQINRQQIHEEMMRKVGEAMGFDEEIAKLRKGGSPHQNREAAELQARRNELAGDLEAHALEAGEMAKRLPQVQQHADVLRQAVSEANTFMGSANALSPIERNLFRRFANFYTFNRTMTLLAFKLPFLNPTSAFLWSRLSQFMQEQALDPAIGDRMKGFTPMWVTQDPKTGEPVQVWVSAKGLSHAGGVGSTNVGGLTLPKMLDPIHANRYIALYYRMKGGQVDPNVATVPYGTDQMYVNLHNGAVETIDVNGNPVVSIKPLPLVKGVAHLFPQVQYAEHILEPYEQTEKGWLLQPDAIKRPDGTYKHPYELMRGLGEMIGPKLVTENRDQLVQEERKREAGILREMVKTMRTAGPEQREMIRQAIIDRQNAMKRD